MTPNTCQAPCLAAQATPDNTPCANCPFAVPLDDEEPCGLQEVAQ